MKETLITIPSQNEEAPRQIIFEETLEAILFAAGHPIGYATLARVFDLTPTKVKELVIDYSLEYNQSDISRGVELLAYPDSCQLVTKPAHLPEIRNVLGIKKNGTLSSAALETLAIVAYNQPVTRLFVDTLRKVDSSYAMNSLIDRGLIECQGRLDVPGRPMLYGTTADFLRCFGLRDLNELPSTSDELMEVFDKAKIAESATDDTGEDDGSQDAIDENVIDSAPQIAMEIEIDEPSADDDIRDDI